MGWFIWSGVSGLLSYALRDGPKGSFRRALYDILPFRGRGLALLSGFGIGSFGSVQYYSWRDGMRLPPEVDLDSDLRNSHAPSSTDFKSGPLLARGLPGSQSLWQWLTLQMPWEKCWAEVQHDTLFLYRALPTAISQDFAIRTTQSKDSNISSGGGNKVGQMGLSWQLRHSKVDKQPCSFSTEAFSSSAAPFIGLISKPWLKYTSVCPLTLTTSAGEVLELATSEEVIEYQAASKSDTTCASNGNTGRHAKKKAKKVRQHSTSNTSNDSNGGNGSGSHGSKHTGGRDAADEQAQWSALLDQSASKRARRLLAVEYPNSWEAPFSTREGYSLHKLESNSKEYKRVAKLAIESQDHPPLSGSGKAYVKGRIRVTGIDRIQSTSVYERYALRRKIVAAESDSGSANVRELWHGTPLLDAVLKHGFDPRYCSMRGLFGGGVYFAENSSKSVRYAGACRPGDSGALILCTVALGDSCVCNTPQTSIRKPPEPSVVSNERPHESPSSHF